MQEETLVWQVKDLDAPEGYFAAVSAPGRFWSAKQSRVTPDMLDASGMKIFLGTAGRPADAPPLPARTTSTPPLSGGSAPSFQLYDCSAGSGLWSGLFS